MEEFIPTPEAAQPVPEAPKPAPQEPKPNSGEVLELLKKIESENAEQVRYAKKQYRMSCVRTAASVLTLVLVVVIAAIFVPQLRQTLTQVDGVLAQVDTALVQVDTVLDNLESTTADLSALVPQLSQSVPALIENLDTLVETSSEEITTALQKISSLDVDSLNTAIRDLQSIVEPLARLFGTR